MRQALLPKKIKNLRIKYNKLKLKEEYFENT